VNREYRRGLRISTVEVLFPTFTTRGQPVRKSRTQLHRAGFQTQDPELNDELGGYYGVEG
jgi:hypothetical protein